MTSPTSNELVPVSFVRTGLLPSSLEADSSRSSAAKGTGFWHSRRLPITISLVLAVAGVLLGSIWFGFAAVLPLLYVAPCLVMAAMCMRGNRCSHESGSR